jgi:hypothetical protein
MTGRIVRGGAAAAVLILLAYHAAPLWRELATWGGTFDWGYFFFLAEVDRKTIVEYGQFPLWNPYYCGGAVHLANPQTFTLSPAVLPILLFGTPIGMRVVLTATLLLSFDGVRRWVLALGGGPTAAVVAGLGHAVSGAMAQHLGGGHIGWLGFALLPYVLASFHWAVEGHRRGVLVGAAFLAWIFVHFGVYPYPYSVLALGAYGLMVGAVERKLGVALVVMTGMGLLSLGLVSLRLFPLLDFISGHPRTVVDSDRLGLTELWEVYGARHTERRFVGHGWVWPEYGNYFGPVGLAWLVLGIGVAARSRRWWPLIGGMLVFIGFQLGNWPWGPWWWVRKLPIFENLRVPSRFTTVAGLFMVAMIGLAVERAAARARALPRRGPWAVGMVALAAAAYLVDASQFNRQQWRQTFGTPPPADVPSPDFHQVAGARWRMYAYPRVNRGSLDCFEESPLDRSPRLSGNAPAEETVQPADAGTVTRRHWSPNEIRLTAELRRSAHVVVNQNFDPHWQVDGGRAVSMDGLLAAKVPAGRSEVVFRYRPRPFVIGWVVSLFAVVGWLTLWIRWRPRPVSD